MPVDGDKRTSFMSFMVLYCTVPTRARLTAAGREISRDSRQERAISPAATRESATSASIATSSRKRMRLSIYKLVYFLFRLVWELP